MRNPISIDARQSRAIAAEIGERLRLWMPVEKELPPALKSLLDGSVQRTESRPANADAPAP